MSRLIAAFWITLVLLAVGASHPPVALACGPLAEAYSELWAETDVIFAGRAVSVDWFENQRGTLVRFQVYRTWKGDVGDEVLIRGPGLGFDAERRARAMQPDHSRHPQLLRTGRHVLGGTGTGPLAAIPARCPCCGVIRLASSCHPSRRQ
jgi:hypothetical protein